LPEIHHHPGQNRACQHSLSQDLYRYATASAIVFTKMSLKIIFAFCQADALSKVIYLAINTEAHEGFPGTLSNNLHHQSQ